VIVVAPVDLPLVLDLLSSPPPQAATAVTIAANRTIATPRLR
jgi:hypothetical protein